MANTPSKQTLAQTLQLGANPVKKFIQPGHTVSCLIFRKRLDPTSSTTGTKQLEPIHFPVKVSNYFCDSNYTENPWRYIGYNQYAVLLNREIGRLQYTARACLGSQDPVSQVNTEDCDLSFADQLVAGLPQFFLCVWELQLNDWFGIYPNDDIRRSLVDDWSIPPGDGYKSPVDVTFNIANTLSRVMFQRPDLHSALTVLRRCYMRQQAVDFWCWLRFFLRTAASL
jgi:hypothetical protein